MSDLDNFKHMNTMVKNRLERGCGLDSQWDLVYNEYKELKSQLQAKDTEIERLNSFIKEFIYYEDNPDSFASMSERLEAKDALVKNLLDVVEFYGGNTNWHNNGHDVFTVIQFKDIEVFKDGSRVGGKKARAILNSDEVKKFKGVSND